MTRIGCLEPRRVVQLSFSYKVCSHFVGATGAKGPLLALSSRGSISA